MDEITSPYRVQFLWPRYPERSLSIEMGACFREWVELPRAPVYMQEPHQTSLFSEVVVHI